MHITWDQYGVPYITGDDDNDVTYGVGVATATAHAGEVLELYGIARGTSAALWGEERFVKEDVFHAQVRLDDVIDTWFDAQPASTMERIAAYCDGFNATCDANPALGAERRAVLPIAPRDVVAQMVRTFTRFSTLDGAQRAFQTWLPSSDIQKPGSNGWAVAGSKSSTGNAMLVINPHLGWMGMHRWFEFRTTSPGRNVHGVTLLGLPWVTIGFNDQVGWTHTVNTLPHFSVYELHLDGDRYEFGGETRTLEVSEAKIEVRDSAPITVPVRRSVHGPVVTAPDGVTVATRIAGVWDHPLTGVLEGWWQAGMTRDVEGVIGTFHEHGLPMFNVLAADSSGSILAGFLGTPPNQDAATFDQLKNGRLPGDDPSYLWSDVHPMAAMPYVIDPACGWVQNVNETPWWFCEPPLDPSAYPANITPEPGALVDVRSPASRGLLNALGDTITPEGILSVKWSTRCQLADVILDELIDAARKEDDLADAADVLAAWDRHASTDSVGYPLFAVWFIASGPEAIRNGLHASGAPSPGAMPTRLHDPEAAVGWLRGAKLTLGLLGFPIDVTLGQFAQMQERDLSVGGDGGFVSLGVMKDLEPLPNKEGKWVAQYGDTYTGLVEFTPEGARAQVVLPYGNVSEPSAPQYTPQVTLFQQSQLRPVPNF